MPRRRTVSSKAKGKQTTGSARGEDDPAGTVESVAPPTADGNRDTAVAASSPEKAPAAESAVGSYDENMSEADDEEVRTTSKPTGEFAAGEKTSKKAAAAAPPDGGPRPGGGGGGGGDGSPPLKRRPQCSVDGCEKLSQGRRCDGMCTSHFTEANPDVPSPVKARQCNFYGCAKYAQGRCGGMCRKHYKLTNPDGPMPRTGGRAGGVPPSAAADDVLPPREDFPVDEGAEAEGEDDGPGPKNAAGHGDGDKDKDETSKQQERGKKRKKDSKKEEGGDDGPGPKNAAGHGDGDEDETSKQQERGKKRKQGPKKAAPSPKKTPKKRRSLDKDGFTAVYRDEVDEHEKDHEEVRERKGWDAWLAELRDFNAEHGHFKVPPGTPLHSWMHRQRAAYSRWELSTERRSSLEAIGFEWKVVDRKEWEDRFEGLKKFHKEHGNLDVPKSSPLYTWIERQRLAYSKSLKGKKTFLTGERKALLDELEFQWKLKERKDWHDHLNDLRKFKERTGHCNVPGGEKKVGSEWKHLANWVANQRAFYRRWKSGEKVSLTEERIAALNELGFQWDVPAYGTPWEVSFEQLKDFKAQHGHCIVPRRKNASLASWVKVQRREKKKYQAQKPAKITAERIAALDSIDFTWSVLDTEFHQKLGELRKFKEETGHCRPPKGSLGSWVTNQRYLYRAWKAGQMSTMTEERCRLLEEIGFDWRVGEERGDPVEGWNSRLRQLEKFQQQTGHCNPSQRAETLEERSLGYWVDKQRKDWRKWIKGEQTKLTEQRRDALNAIGFDWNPLKKAVEGSNPANLLGKTSDIRQSVLPAIQLPEAIDQHRKKEKDTGAQSPDQAAVLHRGSDTLGVDLQQGKINNNVVETPLLAAGHLLDSLSIPQVDGHQHTIVTQQEGHKSSKKWYQRLEELRRYKEQHGHTDVPYRQGTLGYWVNNQRAFMKKVLEGKPSQLAGDRIKALDELGFSWRTSSGSKARGTWEERFRELKLFKEEHGNCDVPKDCSAFPQLGVWVQNQRQYYAALKAGRKAALTEEGIKRLEEIGFVWRKYTKNCKIVESKPGRASFEERLEELRRFRNQNGHTNVPVRGGSLGYWVQSLRRNYRKWEAGKASTLTEDRKKALDALGFEWEFGVGGSPEPKVQSTQFESKPGRISFEERLEELRKFRNKWGHCDVPKRGTSLGNWVGTQRKEYRFWKAGEKSALTDERRQKLEALGFKWKVKDSQKSEVGAEAATSG